MRSPSNSILLAVCVTAVLVGLSGPHAQAPAGRLTIDTLIDIRHPSNPVWSPDSRRVAFVWDRAGVQNIWLVDVAGATPTAPRALTTYEAGDVGGLFWSPDSKRLYYARWRSLVGRRGRRRAAPGRLDDAHARGQHRAVA
jgi:dipeptidyl aminopeptidase/acylaminoacyl peptidase